MLVLASEGNSATSPNCTFADFRVLDCSHTNNLEPLEMQKIAIITSRKTDLFSEVVIANVYVW